MKSYLFLVFVVNLFPSKFFQEDRMRYFPKLIEHVDQLPNKKKVWVFLLAGQSNMAGRGFVEPQDTVENKRILSIDAKGNLVYAKEPLHFYEPKSSGLDCGLSFARRLLQQVPDSITILILPTAIGGTSIQQWLGDSSFRGVRLLTNFYEKVAIGKIYGQIKAVLWHQGENDANKESIPFHKSRMAELFARFRTLIQNDQVPILLGELGSYSNNNDNWQLINRAIEEYTLQDHNSLLITTNDLTHRGDTIHFNSEGQRLIGKRFAEAFLLLGG